MEGELAAIVTEFDCSKTLETGLGRGGSVVAIAAVHEQLGRGAHIAIDARQECVSASDLLERLRGAGLLHRVRFIPTCSEVALPELLRDGTEIDFALIGAPKRFEEAFAEFLYLDRMLVTGGIIALAGPEESAVAAVLEFVAQARAYELRSETGSELAVLRKLGRQRAKEPPFPSRWSATHGRDVRDLASTTEDRARAHPRADRRATASANGQSPNIAATREPHLARTRAAQLDARVAELGTRLLDAEQRAAELLRTRERLGEVELELRATALELHATEVELQHASSAEHWLAQLESSASWRLTAPLRAVKRRARALFGR